MQLQLKRIRKLRGLTQEDMAEKLEIKKSRYGTWERGEANMSLPQACDVADILECTLDELAGREWPRKSFTDPRQESVNESFESMNDTGKETLATVARSLERDASNRIDVKKGGADSRDPLSDAMSEDVA